MRIGILEDDTALATQIEALLSAAGHRSLLFQSGKRLINFLSHETVDLLLLDWNVPDVTGLEILRWQKQHLDIQAPALMLTSRTAEEDIVTALSEGAEDYIIKPIQPNALLARIGVVQRRTQPPAADLGVEQHGGYEFDIKRKLISVGDDQIQLTVKEFALALLFFRNMHRTLSRAYIFETIWGQSSELRTRTLDAHISKLRVKLRLRAHSGFKLVPVYAYGYRLEATE